MGHTLSSINRDLEAQAPALFAALSPLGRDAVFPADIPFQAAEAAGRSYNATIGQITDGRGGALSLPSLARGLTLAPDGPLGAAVGAGAFLYPPVAGFPELRELWRRRQRRGVAEELPSTLPQVTDGLTQGLAVMADLVAGPGRAVVLPDPCWGNYHVTFGTRTRATLLHAETYRHGRFQPRAWADALARLPAGEPALVVLNFPSNPGGYMPSAGERRTLLDSLLAAASERVLVVVCDDAYAGLVYGDVPAGSLFWDLVGRHPSLVPVKADAATKEMCFFGGRVGFLTFPFPPDSLAARAVESKVKGLVHGTVGATVGSSQLLVLQALASPTVDEEIAAVHRVLARRWRLLRDALADSDPALLRPLPSNAGCFVLLELPGEEEGGAGLDPEVLRHHLIDHHDTGVVSIPPRYLRIAHSSLAEEDVGELVRRVERGAAELATAARPA